MDRLSRERAAGLDRDDPLAAFRSRFFVPEGKIYLDGNSLGLASRDAEAGVLRALEEWKRLGVEAWTDAQSPWFDVGERLGALQAPLVGADAHEVVVTGGTTINLLALATTFFDPEESDRWRIVTDEANFPSDVYALDSVARLRGGTLMAVPTGDPPEEALVTGLEIAEGVGEPAAILCFSAVDYRTGRLYDVERLVAEGQARGALVGVDCSHSVGCVPHRLHEWGVDFAVWCNYKYLNGGPGALASLFVHERHHGRRPGLVGWWGSDKERQFQMELTYLPASGAGRWQLGTPPILSAVAVEGAVQLTLEAGMERIREKSLSQTAYLLELAEARLEDLGFHVETPRESERRGGHVALAHPRAAQIARALRRRGVVPDFRPPDIVRLAPAALYMTYAELWECVAALREVVERGEDEVTAAESRVT